MGKEWKSIIQKDPTECYICGRNGAEDPLDKHHVFGGANRKLSEEDGLYIMVCHKRCHIEKLHKDQTSAICMKAIGEGEWLRANNKTIEDFRARYGGNWL